MVPATWEAEARESLEPRRRRLQSTKIMPLYSSLDNKARFHLKKKKKKSARLGGAHLQSQLLGRLRRENCLSPGGGGCSELRIVPLHSSLGNRVRLCLPKKEKESIDCKVAQ